MHGSALAQGLSPRLEQRDGCATVSFFDGDKCVLRPGGAGVTIVVAGKRVPVVFPQGRANGAKIELPSVTIAGLKVSETFESLDARLIRRTTRFTAERELTFFAAIEYLAQIRGDFHSFLGCETKPVCYNQENNGAWAGSPLPPWPGHGDGFEDNGQLFPLAAVVAPDHIVYGIFGDAPARTSNRGVQLIDPRRNTLTVQNGDSRASSKVGIDKHAVVFDHQQTLHPGESQVWTTYLFAAPAVTQYDVQLAAHVALANANGWGDSAVEAIMRNTAYLLCRRNLFGWGAPDANTILISGMSYGWKEWSSDSFYAAMGLQLPEVSQQAYDALYLQRLTYEDNAQLYLIWSALLKRSGGRVNEAIARQAFDFIRRNEKDGAYLPPRIQQDPTSGKPNLGWRTYMDLFFYDDGDCPSSDQGYHCAALLAAKELGFAVTDADVDLSAAVYRSMFNDAGGYFQTSRQLKDIISQDALMGEVFAYALFGRKFLGDDSVRRHIATVEKGRTPNGLRVFCRPDGSLLPVSEYSRGPQAPNPNMSEATQGAYISGGSWFLCDALVPQIVVTAGDKKINLLDAGHRAGDALVRCSALQDELRVAFKAGPIEVSSIESGRMLSCTPSVLMKHGPIKGTERSGSPDRTGGCSALLERGPIEAKPSPSSGSSRSPVLTKHSPNEARPAPRCIRHRCRVPC